MSECLGTKTRASAHSRCLQLHLSFGAYLCLSCGGLELSHRSSISQLSGIAWFGSPLRPKRVPVPGTTEARPRHSRPPLSETIRVVSYLYNRLTCASRFGAETYHTRDYGWLQCLRRKRILKTALDSCPDGCLWTAPTHGRRTITTQIPVCTRDENATENVSLGVIARIS